MASKNYRSPGAYAHYTAYSGGASTSLGFNTTAIVGLARNWYMVNNLELTKEDIIPTKEQILLDKVTPWIGSSPVALGNSVKWDEITSPTLGEIEIAQVQAHWIGVGDVEKDDYVILIDTEEEYGYKKTSSATTGALKVVANITGNGFDISEDSDAFTVIADTTSILLPNTQAAQIGDILEVVGLGSFSGYYNFIKDVDYSIDANNTKITWLNANKPANGSVFYIKYKLNKSEERGDYSPKRYFSSSDIEEYMGPEYLNGVVNPLTLAANLTLEGQTINGGGVILCQVKTDSEEDYKAAIDKLDSVNLNTIICLKQDSLTLRNYLISKVMMCSTSTYKKRRTTMIVPNSDNLELEQLAEQREALNNQRVTYFANSYCNVSLIDAESGEETVAKLSAIYMLCNLSGIEGNPEYGFAEPMLNKKLSPRFTLDDGLNFDPSEQVYLGSKTLSSMAYDENTASVKVFDIFTTDSMNAVTETRSVIRVVDVIADTLEKKLDVLCVGKLNLDSLADSALVMTDSTLEGFKNIQEIKNYRNVSASFNSSNPKLLEVTAQILPLLETKWVDIYLSTYLE